MSKTLILIAVLFLSISSVYAQTAEEYLNRGKLEQFKQFTQAISDFTKAIKINPNDAEAYYGPGNATVTATYGLTNPPLQVTLPITVPPQTVTLTPWSLNFAPLPVGSTSDPQTVALSSTQPLNSIQVTTNGDFSETDNCSTATPTTPITNCGINVKSTPTTVGNITGSLSISTELTGASTSVSLSGTGTAIPFADFDSRLHIYDRSPYGFHLRGSFTLGKGSNGIDPTSEPVTVTIDSYSITIPAGSFKEDLSFPKGGTGFISSKYGRFYFRGQIDNVDLEMTIESDGQKESQYTFGVKGTGVDLSTMVNSPAVSLLIGADMGTATINPVYHYDSDKDEKNGQ